MHRLFVLVFLLVELVGYGQTQAEKELLKAAEKQFEAEEFLDALPAYRQLISIVPQNKDYNFKYGTCLLYSDEDVNEAVNHLNYACKNGNFEDKRAYFYLGKAYHLNYQFADALKSYEDFKGKADAKLRSSFREVDRLMTMAENGRSLLSDIKDIRVLDKTESTVDDFFRNYDLSDIGGSIIKVPEDLLSSLDKKRGHSPLMYFPEGGGEIIFSSYGKSGENLDLYTVIRTSNGGFTPPVKLAGVVNSPFDEDFPFLHSDARTLYFSSKGHNSMGGYDIFQSKRDLSTGLFGAPENLDFAISTPDDDIFYLVDNAKRIAYFASTRNSEEGRLHVYEVAVSNASMELAIVKGKLVNEIGGSRVAQIKVLDANTNEELGVYRTQEDGDYLIDLPGTGKYKFFIDLEDSDITHTGFLDVPSFGKMKAFNQNMELTEVSSQEKLIIKNHFDEEPSEGVLALAQEILKRKASLDINFTGELVEIEESEALFDADDVITGAGFAQGTSMESVLQLAYSQAESLEARIGYESIERDRAFSRSQEQALIAEEKMAEAIALYEKVQSEPDPEMKEELMVETSFKRAEAESYQQQAAISLLLAEELEKVSVSNEELFVELNERNQSIETALADSDAKKASNLLFEVKTTDDKGVSKVDALDTTTRISLDRKRESQKVLGRLEEIQGSRDRIVGSIKTKETLLTKTSKQREKDIITEEIKALKSERADLDVQLERASERLETVEIESETTGGAVILLEKMRMGDNLEIAALEPLTIPSGGLRATSDRLKMIETLGNSIQLSDEEIAHVMAKRPNLISAYSEEQKELLGSFTSIDLAALPSLGDASEIANNEGRELASNEENILDSSFSEIDTLNLPSAGIEFNDDSDFNSYSLNELLRNLQSDYFTAREDIERSDMDALRRAEAKVDLNKAAVQKVEQKIAMFKNSSGFNDDLKQGNVNRLEELVNDLEMEMLDIAKESEQVAQAESLSQGEDVQANEFGTENESFTSGVLNSGLSEALDSHYASIATINADIESTAIVKTSALIKEHSSFVQEVRRVRDVLPSSDGTISEADKAAWRGTEIVLQTKKKELDRAVNEWEESSSLTLTESQKVLAMNYPNYIVERSIAEGSADTAAVEELDKSAIQWLIQESSSWEGQPIDPLFSNSDLATLREMESLATVDAQEINPSNTEQNEKNHLNEHFSISFLGDSKSWTNELFDNKRSEVEMLNLYKEVSELSKVKEGEDRLTKELAVLERFTAPLSEEFLWKEEVIQFESKEEEPSDAVVALIAESYSFDIYASELRAEARPKTDPLLQLEGLRKAVLLELASLNKMDEAIELHKHMKKGRPFSSFRYTDAVVIDIQDILDDEELITEQSIENQIEIADREGLEENLQSANSEKEATESKADDDTERSIIEVLENVQTMAEQTPGSIEESKASETEANIELPASEEIEETIEDLVPIDLGQLSDTGEKINSSSRAEVHYSSATIPQEELQKAPVINNADMLEEMELLDGSTAIRTYPKTSAQLTTLDILPILSYNDEIQLFADSPLDEEVIVDDDSEILKVEDIALLKTKSVELNKARRYQAELDGTVNRYVAELSGRKIRAAEVIDLIANGDSDPELKSERATLTAEIQVIEAYIDQGRSSQFELNTKLNDLIAEQNTIIESAKTLAAEKQQMEEVTSRMQEEDENIDTPKLVEEAVVETEPVTPYSSEYVVPPVLVKDMFSVSEVSSSGNEREIPMNVTLPDGIIYQVQVGAFRKPIPNELFSEFDPILGERLASGITRYKVGLFTGEGAATVARDKIRGLGYSDAFVVRYVDGQRAGAGGVLVATADPGSPTRTSESSNTSNSSADSGASSSGNNEVVSTPSEVDRATANSERDATAYYEAFENAAPATQVEGIKGLFYTVQVGVYSNPVTLSNIFDITPLNSDLLPNGLIKYTSGIFDDPQVAEQWKQKIITKGVSDAFVTAYYNGKRIDLNRASQIVATSGNETLVDINDLNELDSDRQGQAVWEMVSTSELFSEEVRNQIEFKIRMGPYFDRIPDKDVKVILDFEDNVEYSRREDNAIIYTTKGSMTYKEAQTWRTTFLDRGITNANIIAMQNGTEVPVKQALDFLLK